MAKKKMAAPLPVPAITAYKAFGMDMKCRDFQFEIGKTYQQEGQIERCKNGFHSCEYPLDMFSYYAPASSRFAVVNAGGDVDRETDGDTKIASATLHIEAEMFIPAIVTAAIKWVTDRYDLVKTKHSTGDRSASSATGYRSASSATGDQSASSATGYQSASSATGDQSASSATGDRSASSATGYQSASSATGDRSASSATGYQSASSATGDQSASSATGYRSASSATGYRSASSATGDQSASSATGDQSASSATGYQSASSATGKNSVAMNIGIQGKAKASKGGAIVLVNHGKDYNIRHIRASKVGDNGIKPDVWYVLSDENEFVEA